MRVVAYGSCELATIISAKELAIYSTNVLSPLSSRSLASCIQNSGQRYIYTAKLSSSKLREHKRHALYTRPSGTKSKSSGGGHDRMTGILVWVDGWWC